MANYSVFSQCYFRSGTVILMAVCSFWIFQESFPKRGLRISINGRFIFSVGFIFKWTGHSIGVASTFMGGGKKIYALGGTLIMPLPTRTKPGLCCNRIKKKHELQYALENLQEKNLNISWICAKCLFNGWFQTVTEFKQSLKYVLGNFYFPNFISTRKLDWGSGSLCYRCKVPKKKFHIYIQGLF